MVQLRALVRIGASFLTAFAIGNGTTLGPFHTDLPRLTIDCLMKIWRIWRFGEYGEYGGLVFFSIFRTKSLVILNLQVTCARLLWVMILSY